MVNIWVQFALCTKKKKKKKKKRMESNFEDPDSFICINCSIATPNIGMFPQ